MVLTLFVLFLSSGLWGMNAHGDLSLGMQGRSAPSVGAEAYLDTGYNLVWWGKKERKSDVLYGLIRPSLNLSTSGVINSVKGELEFFPISFLGVSVGRQIVHSNYEFPFFNCDVVLCKGEYQRNFIEGKMALGAGGWITTLQYKVDVVKAPHSRMPLADWRNIIIGDNGRDVQIDKKMVIGKIVDAHLYGLLLENVSFQGSGEMRESYAAAYQFKYLANSYMFALGVYRTSQTALGGILYFRVNSSLIPSSKLF